MATQPCIGFPADTLGTDGDAAQDLKNRVIYFPKANGTWANATPYTFQGQVGPGILTGSGAPAANLGSPGSGYADLSSSGYTYLKNSQNVWNQAGQIVGAQGIAGPSGQSVPALTTQSYSFAPIAANGTALALSGSPQLIPFAGGTQAFQFVPTVSTTFAGATLVLSSANSPGATSYTLYDQTAGQAKWSYTISAAGTVTNQLASVALTTGNTHVWQVAGSGNAFVQALGVFLQPASTGVGVTYAPLMATNFTTAPTSATPLNVNGNAAIAQYMGVLKTAFLYSAQFVNTGTSSATVALYNSAGTILYSTTVNANQTTPALAGPFTVNQYVLSAGYYTWRVTSSSTGYVSVLPQLCL